MLTWRYRPDGGGPRSDLPSSLQWSRRLVEWHEASIYLSAVALVIWGGLTAADRTWPSRRPRVLFGSTVATLALVALSAMAWSRVRWEQLGLWAVTAGFNISGLWYAAFSDEVRFVFVDGSGELAPSDLAPWVVLHLVAPFVALATLAIGWLVARPTRGPRRSIVAAPVEPTTVEGGATGAS